MITWRSSQTSFFGGEIEVSFKLEGQNLSNEQLWYLIRKAKRHLNEYVAEVPTDEELKKRDSSA
jgi:hypothetical protein